MNNRDIQAAWKYHDGTKHSYWSIRNNPHFLDWANRPLSFKIYPTIEPLPLPREVPQTGVAALSAISERVTWAGCDSLPDLGSDAHPLFLGGNHQTARKSGWRNLLSRRSLHRSSLRDRAVHRDWRSQGPGCWHLSLQPGGPIATAPAKG